MIFRLSILVLGLLAVMAPNEGDAIVDGVPDADFECVGSVHDLATGSIDHRFSGIFFDGFEIGGTDFWSNVVPE